MPPNTTFSNPLHEAEVLKPHDPSLTDENDWEEFQLASAEVRDAATDEPTSLLDADAASPVTVIGRLEPLPRDQSHLLAASAPAIPKSGVPVALRKVTRFAYGQYEDGEVAIWAAGEAGWFRLAAPSRAYRDVFADMVGAISVLYFLADAYSRDRDAAARTIFKRYAAENSDEFRNTKEAAEGIYRHKEFLMLSMLRGKDLEDPAWSYTDIFKHLKDKFPEAYARMERKEAGKKGVDKRKKIRRRTPSQKTGSQEVHSADDSGKPAVPKKDNNWWEAKVVWEMMQKVQIQGLLAPKNMTVENFGKVMVRKYEVDDAELAADYIRAHASNLMYMMAHKRKPAVKWTEQPVYAELSQVKLSASVLRKASELEIRRRRDPLPDPEPELGHQLMDQDSSSEDVPVPAPRRGRKPRHSLLRPKGGKYSGKGATRSGKTYHRSSGDEDDGTDAQEVALPPKRKTEAEDENNRRKRQTSRSHIQHPFLAVSPPESGDERKATLPLRWKTPQSQRATPGFAPTIISEAAATADANSPGDIWRCTHDGCVRKVYGASLDESQVLIAEHLDEHDAKRKEAVELARSEELRSNLPVSNLIKRIREMADAQQNAQLMGLTGIGASNLEVNFPSPVRKYY
ncbi:hypothetical protein MPH_07058 [Macrophomina phaseolina MS6]|uniref:DNA (cytosine-5)-methyltransferase 1 replication foci domain-containing protein n=1 Tax=Macrophomina phaseolina (strain MS6) TaxID=1126212 RepID=K2RLQ8_MACPH|nr:hypothetical protein MPH_07058 [Macrophomina phaseolina MS6]